VPIKLMKLSEFCKAPENKSDYIWKNSVATTSMTFQPSLICQQKFKQITVEESFINCQKGVAPVL